MCTINSTAFMYLLSPTSFDLCLSSTDDLVFFFQRFNSLNEVVLDALFLGESSGDVNYVRKRWELPLGFQGSVGHGET